MDTQVIVPSGAQELDEKRGVFNAFPWLPRDGAVAKADHLPVYDGVIPTIFVASPLAAPKHLHRIAQINRVGENMDFAREVCRKLAHAGAATFAPHLYYTQFLDDADVIERQLGIKLGVEHMRTCHEVWFVTPKWAPDPAASGGMVGEARKAVEYAKRGVVIQMEDEVEGIPSGLDMALAHLRGRIRP